MNDLLYTVQIMNNQQKEDSATLEILQVIENKNDITQRHLADRLDVALGLANSYLKRCVRKGLVKIHQAPANRYLYYLTPKGFAEKSRLTTEYLSNSFDFYRKASESLIEVFNDCENRKQKNIIFCGVSELAEIASLKVLEHNLNIVGLYDTKFNKSTFIQLPVWKSVEDCADCDVFILTSLKNASDEYKSLVQEVDPEKILIPSILGIVT